MQNLFAAGGKPFRRMVLCSTWETSHTEVRASLDYKSFTIIPANTAIKTLNSVPASTYSVLAVSFSLNLIIDFAAINRPLLIIALLMR